MRLRTIGIAWMLAVLLLGFGAVMPALAGEGHDHGHGEMPAEMAAWMKYMQPDENHEFLQRLAGKWNAKGKFWMQPGEPPMENEGTSESEMILGGRFLQTSYSGEFMGQPFSGMALDGFDRMNEKYIGTWIDTMGTMMMVFEGSIDEAGRARTMISEHKDPMTGEMAKMKGVTTIVSENEHKYEAYHQGPDGEWVKAMEITYTRR